MNKGMPNRYKPAWKKGSEKIKKLRPDPSARRDVGQAIKKGPSRGKRG